MKSAQRAFTLVELLIALAILALLVLGAYRAMTTLIDSERQLAAEQNRWQALARVFDRFEADLQRALPRPARLGANREPAMIGVNREAAAGSLRFSRAGDADPLLAQGGQRIEYRTQEGRLELVLWPAFDLPPATAPQVLTLLEGVSSFRLRFASQGRWLDRWPEGQDLGSLPRGVEISLRLADGEDLQRIVVLP